MKVRIALVLACLISLAVVAPANAATPGALDKTFSNDGIASSSLLSNSAQTWVQVDAKNRVLVAGYDANLSEGLVLRYKANGTLDSTWGDRFIPDSVDGLLGLFVVGAKTIVGTSDGYAVRLNANGSLDKTFGVGGLANIHKAFQKAEHDFDFGLTDIAANAAGVIYATAWGGTGEGFRDYLIKVSANGRFFSFFPGAAPLPLTVSPNYVYVLGGDDSCNESNSVGEAVSRYFLKGALDTSYGTDGCAWFTAGDSDSASGIAVSPTTGEVVIAGTECPLMTGYCSPDQTEGFVARFTSTGIIDTTFNGQVYFGDGDASKSVATSVTLQSGGVVVAGTDVECNNATKSCFGLERLTNAGVADTTFAGTGHVHTATTLVGATSVRIFNTKIVVAGGQYVARYNG